MAKTTTADDKSYQIVDGFKIPKLFTPENFRSALQYKPRPDDVFVVTYPKCGTTWAQHMLVLIFSHGEPILSVENFFAAAPFLEFLGAKSVENMPRPGAIKVHLPYHLTPMSSQTKYIYITRNPKDCCVSFFYHMRDTPVHGFKGTFDDFFEVFLEGDIDYGDYFDHLMEWYEHRNDPNVLFLTYEEMKSDAAWVVLKMASFIDDETYAKPLREDPEKLNNVLLYSSFKYMQEVVNKGMDEMMKNMSNADLLNQSEFSDEMKQAMGKVFDKVESEDPKNFPSTSTFVRKGIVGDWRNHFNEDQSKRMDEKFEERTRGTEIANWWKDCMQFDRK